MVNKAYNIRIYPNKEQRILINKTFGCCRYVYNYFLAERIRLYKEESKTVSVFDTIKLLTPIKQELDWLKEPDKCSLQNSLKDLNAAYMMFFKGKGFPKFKSKKDHHKSYRTDCNIHIFEKYIQLPKLGNVRFRGKHNIQGIGANFIPENFDRSICDEIITVSDEDAFEMVRKLGEIEGLLVGISSGANIYAAIEIAKKYKDKTIVTIAPDGIDKYMSIDIF